MTDEEYRQQVQKRWQESMALLGLEDPGPEQEPKKAEPAGQPVMPPAARLPVQQPEETEPPRTVQAEVRPAAGQVLGFDPEHGQHRELELAPESARLEFETTAESAEEPAEEASRAVQAETSEEELGRRRRGRRGRRGKKPETAATEGEGRAGEKPGKGEEESRKREGSGRQGRGRPRQRTAKPTEPEAAEPEEPVTEAAADDSDFGDDEPTNPSEWNVPSWQELIASLYRPER